MRGSMLTGSPSSSLNATRTALPATCRTAPTPVRFPERRLCCRTKVASSRLAPSDFSASQMFEVRTLHYNLPCAGCAHERRLTMISFAGNLRSLNELAKTARADYILHTGDFGFYDGSSLERIAEK